jgi:hypothetical protein
LQLTHIQADFLPLPSPVLHRIVFPVVSEWYQELVDYASPVPMSSGVMVASSWSPLRASNLIVEATLEPGEIYEVRSSAKNLVATSGGSGFEKKNPWAMSQPISFRRVA